MVHETVLRQLQQDQRFLIFMTGADRTLLYVNSTARRFMDSAKNRLHTSAQVQYLLQFIQQRSDVCLEYPLDENVVDCAHSACFRIFSDRLSLWGNTPVFLHIVRDLTVPEDKSRMLFCSAVTDPLTGLLNRRGGLLHVDALLEASCGETHTLAFLDLDGLKKVNDCLGHEEGDHYITALSDILRTSIRNTDILCRYGGDEFLIVFRNCAPVTSKQILARAKEKAREQGESWGKPYPVSFSYGISTLLPSQKDDFLALLRQADMEMYRMKQRQAL